jgi:hypothetical protein
MIIPTLIGTTIGVDTEFSVSKEMKRHEAFGIDLSIWHNYTLSLCRVAFCSKVQKKCGGSFLPGVICRVKP